MPEPDRLRQEAAPPPYILIVDDRHSDLRLLEAILRAHGYRSLALTDPTRVLEQCRAALPEIILLDISMPELDGFQVCGQLKADPQLAEIPVLFLTAMSEVANRVRGFKAGGSDFLMKPYEPSELIARVSTHIRLRKAQQELARRNEQLREKICDIERAHAALLESEARSEAVLNNAGVCIGLLSGDCAYEQVNGLYAEIFGYTQEEFRAMRLWDILHPDFVAQAKETVERLRGGTLDQHYAAKQFVRKDGSQFPGGHWLSPHRDSGGRCCGFVCVISDLTGQQEAEDRLRLAHTVFETSSEGMMVTDADNRIVMVNPAFTAITGYLSEEAIGRKPSFLKSSRHDREFFRQMWTDLLREGRWQGEVWNRRRSGEVYPLWLSIAVIRSNKDGGIANYVALFSDISERKRVEEILHYQAMHDPLTKLANRVMFDERLRASLARARRRKSLVALLYLDLDDFKSINDSLGHLAGDRVLQLAAEKIQSCLRLEDVAARLGGDEFCAVLDDISSVGHAMEVAERIIAALGSLDCCAPGQGLRTSIGIAIYPHHGVDIETLLGCADQAMYTAKRLGKGRSHLSPDTAASSGC